MHLCTRSLTVVWKVLHVLKPVASRIHQWTVGDRLLREHFVRRADHVALQLALERLTVWRPELFAEPQQSSTGVREC